MASRAQQKEEARQRRLAEERARAEQAARQRRMFTIAGIVLAAVIVAGVAIAISTIGGKTKTGPPPTSAAGRQQVPIVGALLNGIPQSGNRLGSPSAKVTVTEFGDLECPVCRSFALGAENKLISQDVRAGKVQLIYRSLCTATCNGPNASWFNAQQAAAEAAGLQGKEWYYVELFYHEQGDETTAYVNDSFLNEIAAQVPGLNYASWLSARSSQTLINQVTTDQQNAAGHGFNSTPAMLFQGPKGTTSITGDVDYSTLEHAIKTVS
ncbi:MAG TPA: thioredoxin domain-containing protein [Solirubrobacteraceae bacterium]|nr:thioredoxin domain-containing protein [Solirubrobacteraceae bacterium]